jgi:hypothetical protein
VCEVVYFLRIMYTVTVSDWQEMQKRVLTASIALCSVYLAVIEPQTNPAVPTLQAHPFMAAKQNKHSGVQTPLFCTCPNAATCFLGSYSHNFFLFCSSRKNFLL